MIRNISGVHSQMSTSTTATKAVLLWASTSGGPSPNNWNIGLTTPTPLSYSRRHITPTTTGAIVIGRIRPTRIEAGELHLA